MAWAIRADDYAIRLGEEKRLHVLIAGNSIDLQDRSTADDDVLGIMCNCDDALVVGNEINSMQDPGERVIKARVVLGVYSAEFPSASHCHLINNELSETLSAHFGNYSRNCFWWGELTTIENYGVDNTIVPHV